MPFILIFWRRRDNTIVVITGDNGWPFPRGKANLYDYGTRQPLAVRWPARVPGGRVVEDFISFCDFAPTFVEAAGVTPPPEMTGRSFLDVLTGGKSGRVDPKRDRVVVGLEKHGQPYPMRSIRTHAFRYIRLRRRSEPRGTDPLVELRCAEHLAPGRKEPKRNGRGFR